MNVYGTGPFRSGTTMLAECLNIVREAHHECGTPRVSGPAGLAAWKGEQVDLAAFVDHGVEVAYWWTFVADRLEGKVIHLWRPVSAWVPSSYVLGIYDEGLTRPFVGAQLEPPEGLSLEARFAWLYREYHSFLLENRPDAYVTTPDRIVWSHLFSWLGWDVGEDVIRNVQGLQRMRPNNRERILSSRVGRGIAVPDLSLLDVHEVERQTSDIEEELERRTPFTREESFQSEKLR